MDIEIWHIWIIVAVILFIVEIFAPSFLFGSVAIGCILAGFVSAFDCGIKIQLIAFAIGTLVAFFGIRPFMLKYLHKKSDKIKYRHIRSFRPGYRLIFLFEIKFWLDQFIFAKYKVFTQIICCHMRSIEINRLFRTCFLT